jgi:flavin reductase (DIM6/NTAB) family NADH-FMN oxidoreductase RutF
LHFYRDFDKLCLALKGPGAFLVVEDGRGGANPMTIGWAQLGVTWGLPVMSVLVRPSRHTYSLLRSASCFTVCVPREGEMRKELAFCGSRSGRDADKAKECGLVLRPGSLPGSFFVEGSALVYECSLLHRTPLTPGALPAELVSRYYPEGDWHDIFTGEVKLLRGAK